MIPWLGFIFFGGGHYFGTIFPEIKSASKLLIFPYTIYTIVNGINEFNICTIKGHGLILQ
jgi:hypothetical protein